MDLNEISLPTLSTSGEVISFYSYKGGAGRTMALANIAQRLASAHNGAQPILMIDWDLEAPSLHHYFNCKLDGPGVLELFQACQDALFRLRGAPPRDPEGLGAVGSRTVTVGAIHLPRRSGQCALPDAGRLP